MPERQARSREEVSFGKTMDPNIRRISDKGGYIGILLCHGRDFTVEWHTKNSSSVRTPLHVLEAVIKERNRILEERRQEE